MASSLEKSLGLDKLNYPVPAHSNSIKYMLGGITIFCIALAVLSGIFLAMFYNPDPANAHASISNIASNVYFGDFARSVHFWSANIAMLLVIFHIVRVFVSGSYKKPRQATWLTGVLLLVIMISLFFSGTVLKWDQEAVEAQGHLDAIADDLGSVGQLVLSTAGSVPYLVRLYALHVSILMMALFGVLALHLWLIKRHGISPKPVRGTVTHATAGRGSANFKSHLKLLTGFGLLAMAGVFTLALIFPAALGPAGVAGMEVTKPPWLFLPLYGLENEFGLSALVWAPVVILLLMLLVPFVDRNQWVSPRQRKIVVIVGALLIATLVVLGYNAWRSPVHSHLGTAPSAVSQSISGWLFPKVSAHGTSSAPDNHVDEMTDANTVAAAESAADIHLPKRTLELAVIFSLILIFTFAGAILVLS